jgi:hypothetical protein
MENMEKNPTNEKRKVWIYPYIQTERKKQRRRIIYPNKGIKHKTIRTIINPLD